MELTVEFLAHYFVVHVLERWQNNERRIETAKQAINKFLNEGWSLEELKEEMDQFKKTYPSLIKNIYHLEEIIGTKTPPSNLIEPDVFYYHNILREVPPPTVISFDQKTGKLIRKDHAFYLEMKKRFTMKELLSYWYNSNGMRPDEHQIKKDEGRFRYLLQIYTLDEILFAIDVAQTSRKEHHQKPLRNVFELENYIEEAREFIEAKKNASKLEGINKVIKKSD